MSAMRFLRKHNKKILVGVGCVLMVAFLLPSAIFYGSGQRNPAEQDVAYFNDIDGKQIEITQGMLEAAENELKALEMLKISDINMYQFSKNMSLPGFIGVGSGPILTTHVLLFSSQSTDPQTTNLVQGYRNELYMKVESSDWAEEEETLNFLKESIQRLTGVEGQDAAYYYLLLAYEAQQMGIRPTMDTVDNLLELRQVRNIKIADILKKCNLRETGQLKKAVANYVAIVRYCDLMTKTLAISEPQLKKIIRDNIQIENVSGTYVTFRASQFRDQAGEPKLEELQEQLDQYKACEPIQDTEENPHGFGYRLPDRVKIEFLMIDLDQVQKGIENKFAQKDILERGNLIQSYWNEDKTWYVNQYKARQEKPEDDSQENSSDDTRDERYARLQWEQNKVWQKRQALQTAKDLLHKAKDNSQKILSIADLKQIPPVHRGLRAANYSDLAKQLNKNSDPNDPAILFNPDYDDYYFSEQELYRLGWLSSAEYRRPRQTPLPLADILFQCKPLHTGILTRHDETPAELYEDIGPLETGRPGSERAVFLVRIVGVDPARPPASLYDDGTLGAAPDSFDPNENNPMFLHVKRDWQTLQEFSLAIDQANRFAELSDPNWAGTIAKVNEEHNREDPNLPGPLWENSLENTEQQLENIRQQITRMQELLQNNPQIANYFQSELQNKQMQIIGIYQLRQKAMELAQQRQDQNTTDQDRAVLIREDKLSCLVFKDLKLAPASQQEYLRRKPMNTRDTIWSEQEMLAVIHLTPGNIEKRTGFHRKTYEGK